MLGAWTFIRPLLPYIAAVAAVLGAIWYIDQRAVERTENIYEREKSERKAAQAQADLRAQQQVTRLERSMQSIVSQVDAQLGTRLRSLTQLETTVIQPTLTREIRSEKRFSDPSPGVGITDGMRGAINAARSTTNPACAPGVDGSATCSLPAATPVEGQRDRDSSN